MSLNRRVIVAAVASLIDAPLTLTRVFQVVRLLLVKKENCFTGPRTRSRGRFLYSQNTVHVN